jgi:ankyrin repeat protein
MLSRGANPNLKLKSDGQVPLHTAAAKNQRGAAEALLQHGAEVDARDSDGQTPLMEAARSGSIEVLQLLLDRHANVDYQDKEGRTALVWAATKGDWPKVVKNRDPLTINMEMA